MSLLSTVSAIDKDKTGVHSQTLRSLWVQLIQKGHDIRDLREDVVQDAIDRQLEEFAFQDIKPDAADISSDVKDTELLAQMHKSIEELRAPLAYVIGSSAQM